jgi:hypothetical protein
MWRIALSSQQSARATVWCCVDRHPSPSKAAKNKPESRESEGKTQNEKGKTLNHAGRRGAQRKIPLSGIKAVLCHRFALMSADLRAEPETMEQFLEGTRPAQTVWRFWGN